MFIGGAVGAGSAAFAPQFGNRTVSDCALAAAVLALELAFAATAIRRACQ